ARFYKSHPDQYIMGMLYARTLLLDQQFATADRVLSHLQIIPFEGATSGRELYREAKLMQAVECIKAMQYKKALNFIEAAKQWPENLGVGEPYAADKDLRLEDWMSDGCRQALRSGSSSSFFRLPPPMAHGGSGVNDRVLAALQSQFIGDR
ncbi:MAG TPA: hypothetical protein VNU72_03925, partial [Puia sp.]|nr:hypothetical protein [Puia sp.]